MTKHRFTTVRKVKAIVVLFVSIATLLAVMMHVESRVFDGVRAYVKGEGLWAKAQKAALLHLERYSREYAESDYLAFRTSLGVIAGDTQARMSMLASPPDLVGARAGILQGQNDEQDVDSLIWFFLNFHNVSYMRNAIDAWTTADNKIAELEAIGLQIKAEVTAPQQHAEHMLALRMRLRSIDVELLKLENHFSETLSEGARWVRTTALQASLALVAVFIAVGIWVSRRIIHDIADAERELLVSESRFSSLKQSNTIGIVSWRRDGSLDEANELFLRTLGYSSADLAQGALNWIRLTPAELRERDMQAMKELEAHGRCEPYEKLLLHKCGHTVPVFVGASVVKGEEEHGIAFVVDVTEKKRVEDIIRQQANFDTLTELPNRRLVHDRLQQHIKMSRREGLPLALMFIDLDGFKAINDKFGHDVGDAVLMSAANRMRECVRETDTLGRLGGDEFVIVLGQLESVASADRVGKVILKVLSEPIALPDQTVQVSASIGIAFYPDDADDIPELFACADRAMYAVKRNGRNGICHYASLSSNG